MSGVPIDQALTLAGAHRRAGRLADAQSIYVQILAVAPKHPEALHSLGVIAHQTGRSGLAVELMAQAIQQDPQRPAYYLSFGNACRASGQADQAIAAFRVAIRLKPDSHAAHNNLGNALQDRGRLDEAIAEFRAAIRLKPNLAEAYSNLGNALCEQGHLEDAIDACRAAIRLKSDFADPHNNLGNALKNKGQLDEAIAAYRTAIQIKPDFSGAYFNLSNTLSERGKPDEAVAAYRAAIQINSGYARAQFNLASALHNQGRFDDAIAALRTAIRFKPDYAEAYNNLGHALKDEGQLDESVAAFRTAIELIPDSAQARSNLLYTLHFHPGYDARSIHQEHQVWNQRHAEPLAELIQPHVNERSPERRLKIGYVSPDLREHPVGRFLLPLLGAHNREQCEIICYAQVSTPDEFTEQIRSRTDQWRSIAGLSDEQVAHQIREDGIDILVDLALHMAKNRLLVFARKPAPVQVTYLGYAGSTGLTAIDYRLTDPYLDPAGMNDAFYSERSVRLPETYWCYAPTCPEIPVGPLPAQQGSGVTFGSLNNFCKVTEPTLAAWCRLMGQVPGSRLILHAHEGSHRQRVWETFAKAGIDPQRVSFVGLQLIADYYREYQRIDIALDPFPYAGGTTTCDALWMGVPVVSLCGQSAVARGGLSVLSNVGLPELVAHLEDEYVQIAAALASDLGRLGELRSTLRRRMEASPLMDAPRFARNVEAAYRQMWRTWCAST